MPKRVLGLTITQIALLGGLLVCGSLALGTWAIWLFAFAGGQESVSEAPAAGLTAPMPSGETPSAHAPTVSSSKSIAGRWTLLPPPTPTPWPGTKPPPPTIYSPLSIFPKSSTTPMPTLRPMTITIDFCGITFGHSLEFFADGTYAGVAGALLPGGSYSVLPDGRLKLATKGGISVYPFSISGNVLTIRATSSTFSCKLQYQRAQ